MKPFIMERPLQDRAHWSKGPTAVRPLYHRQPKKKPSMVEGSEADGDETLCVFVSLWLDFFLVFPWLGR